MEKTNIAASFRGAAIGATIALLPATFAALLTFLKVIDDFQGDTLQTIAIVQAIGSVAWATCSLTAIGGFKKRRLSIAPLVFIAIGAFAGAILQIISVASEDMVDNITKDFLAKESSTILVISALLANIPIFIGTVKMREFRGMPLACAGSITLAVYPYLLIKLINSKCFFVEAILKLSGVQLLMLIFVVLLLAAELLVVIGLWRAAGSAEDIDRLKLKY